jgi:23S rRNA (guanosine2251-2'-O)-methyltransferase
VSRVLFSKNAIRERLGDNNFPCEILILSETLNKADEKFFSDLARSRKVKVQKKPKNWFEQKFRAQNHQGIILQVPDFEYKDLQDILNLKTKNQLVCLLDSVEDPRNLGAVLRSAECLGAVAVVIPQDRSAEITPAAEKTSAGASQYISVVRVVNLVQTVNKMKNVGFWIYGLSQKASKNILDVSWPEKICLVLGSESDGIRPLLEKNCDELVKIPQVGKTESYNVSVAAALVMFDIQKKFLK